MPAAWAPALADVAEKNPQRTRDMVTPGSGDLLGTFTEATVPTAGQAQAAIDEAVQSVLARTGALPTGPADVAARVEDLARSAAAWRAAADIQAAYVLRDADLGVYDRLNGRAGDALASLLAALAGAGQGAVAEFPVWASPDPPAWADQDPGDRPWPAFPYWSGVPPGD